MEKTTFNSSDRMIDLQQIQGGQQMPSKKLRAILIRAPETSEVNLRVYFIRL